MRRSCSLAGLAILIAGCRQPPVGNVSVKELRAFADVAVGRLVWDADFLRIPLDVRQEAGESVSVLTWDGAVSSDIIPITANHSMIWDHVPPKEVLIRLSRNPPERFRVTFLGPDGVTEDLREIDVAKR